MIFFTPEKEMTIPQKCELLWFRLSHEIQTWVRDVNLIKKFANEIEEAAYERGKADRDCAHPGCCCVCGHRKLCPEDGPSIVQGVHD